MTYWVRRLSNIAIRLTMRVMSTALEGSISMLKNDKVTGKSLPWGLLLFFVLNLSLPNSLIGQKKSFGSSFGVYVPKITGGAVAGDVVVVNDPTNPEPAAFL